ncbi:recombinase family protein [Luteimicrobium sp. NPDC057192]|uniref:recombinase family protein n=1 Tax=Luteimicrobium sp. NPDC057192 TaxID=3346042 RepID=UPI003642C6D4
MQAIIYARISLDRTGEGLGVERQLEDARELARQRGWTVVAEHVDNDTSAAGSKKRPGFENLLLDIQVGRAQAVIAWALDRLTRNRRDTVRLIETCQAASATVALVRGSDMDLTTPSGRVVADVLASFARLEIETKSDRQRRANDQRAHAGLPAAGGPRPFGYEPGGLSARESEARLIREGYATLLAGGSLRAIARRWNDAGALTSKGNAWNGTTARRALQSPRYAALRKHRGELVGGGKWTPVVSEETWRAAQHLLADPERNRVTDRSIKFLLTNIAECGRCEGGSKVGTARTSKGVRTYKCAARSDVARKAEPIDEYVEAVVIARLARDDARGLLRDRGREIDVESMRHDAQALRVRLDEAAALFAAGEIRATQLGTITRDLEAKLEGIEATLAEAGKQDALVGLVGADDVAAAWTDLDIMTKRAVLRTLFERIVLEPVARGSRTFHPESVRLEWRA